MDCPACAHLAQVKVTVITVSIRLIAAPDFHVRMESKAVDISLAATLEDFRTIALPASILKFSCCHLIFLCLAIVAVF